MHRMEDTGPSDDTGAIRRFTRQWTLACPYGVTATITRRGDADPAAYVVDFDSPLPWLPPGYSSAVRIAMVPDGSGDGGSVDSTDVSAMMLGQLTDERIGDQVRGDVELWHREWMETGRPWDGD